jgi:benzoate membrane transport protein
MVRNLPPLASWSSALVAALVGFGGTIALVVQAMRAMGASVAQTGSAITALCLGIALAGALLSFRLRMPVILAWSTPGAALLAASTPMLTWPVAIGVFASASLMMVATGLVPVLGRLANRIPPAIASAMLAGILLPFCLALFKSGGADPLLLLLLLVTYVAARRRLPLYALLFVLAVGVAATLVRGDLAALQAGVTFGVLVPTMASFNSAAILNLALPLFLVTLVSQNLPGLVVLRAAGFEPKPGPLIVGTGIASLFAVPFGAHSINLAAITAAICTGDDAHPEREKRWVVGLLYAGFYLLLALFSPVLVRLFLALPTPVVAALTGLALIPAFVAAVEAMLTSKNARDPALLTFLATASGLTLFGLGSAFWGLVAGFGALAVRQIMEPPRTA